MKLDTNSDFDEARYSLTTLISQLFDVDQKITQYSETTIDSATTAKKFTDEIAENYPSLRPAAHVQQDIYAHTITLWTQEQKDLRKQVLEWKEDVNNAITMISILENQRSKPEVAREEFFAMKVDVENRVQHILDTRHRKIEAIISKFLAIQHSYFSTATRLAGTVIKRKASVGPDLSSELLQELLRESVGSEGSSQGLYREEERPQIPVRGEAPSTDAAPSSTSPPPDLFPLIKEYGRKASEVTSPDMTKIDPVVRQLSIDDAVAAFAQTLEQKQETIQAFEEQEAKRVEAQKRKEQKKVLSEPKMKSPTFEQVGNDFNQWVNDIFSADQGKSKAKKRRVVVSDQPHEGIFDLPVPSPQPQSAAKLVKLDSNPGVNNPPYTALYVTKLRLCSSDSNSPSDRIQLEAGGPAVECKFHINTPIFGDCLNIDWSSEFLDVQAKGGIVIQEKATSSNTLSLSAKNFAPTGSMHLNVLLSGANVQNLKTFEFCVPVEIAPRHTEVNLYPSVLKSGPKLKEEKVISSAEPSLLDDLVNFVPKAVPPAVAPQLEGQQGDILDDFFRQQRPVQPEADPFPFFPAKKEAAVPAEKAKEKPKPITKVFEKGRISSTGEGFRLEDIERVFDRYASKPGLVNADRFRMAWDDLCLSRFTPWRAHFEELVNREDRTFVRKDDFITTADKQMQLQAAEWVKAELDLWDFAAPSTRKPFITLLATMKGVLTYNTAYWKPPQIGDLMQSLKVRRIFRKTIRVVHPDRTRHLIYVDRARAKRVFIALTDSYKAYSAEHQV